MPLLRGGAWLIGFSSVIVETSAEGISTKEAGRAIAINCIS